MCAIGSAAFAPPIFSSSNTTTSRRRRRLAAAVTPPLPGDVDVLAPRLTIDGEEHRVRLLDMSAVPLTMMAETVGSATGEADAILNAIDVILHGYPVGRGS